MDARPGSKQTTRANDPDPDRPRGFGAQGRSGSGAVFDASGRVRRAAQVLGAIRPSSLRNACVRSQAPSAPAVGGLVKMTTRANEKHPKTSPPPIQSLPLRRMRFQSAFHGVIDLINPQKTPVRRCGRSGFGRATLTSGSNGTKPRLPVEQPKNSNRINMKTGQRACAHCAAIVLVPRRRGDRIGGLLRMHESFVGTFETCRLRRAMSSLRAQRGKKT